MDKLAVGASFAVAGLAIIVFIVMAIVGGFRLLTRRCKKCGRRGHRECDDWLLVRARDIVSVAKDIEESPVDQRSFQIERQDPRIVDALKRIAREPQPPPAPPPKGR